MFAVFPKLVIDLANPSLVREIKNIEIINTMDLSLEANKNLDKRISEVSKARSIINKQYINMAESLKKEIGKIYIYSRSGRE